MITDAIAVTRGTGLFSKEFDFGASTPTVDVTADDKWMCQVLVGFTVVLLKLNDNAGGSDEQVALDLDDDLVTVYLTEKEKNELPDSGYTYKLFKYNTEDEEWEVMAYAAVTASGTPAFGYVPESVQWVNGDARRILTSSGSIKADDDYILGSPANLVEHIYDLPDADTMAGKLIKVKNRGQGTISVVKPNATEIVELTNIITYAEILALGSDANDWLLVFIV